MPTPARYRVEWAAVARRDLEAIISLGVFDGRRNLEDVLLERLVRS